MLTPDIFDLIRSTPAGRNGEIQITDALHAQAVKNMVLAYRFKARRFDCGSVEGFVAATTYFYDRWKENEGGGNIEKLPAPKVLRPAGNF